MGRPTNDAHAEALPPVEALLEAVPPACTTCGGDLVGLIFDEETCGPCGEMIEAAYLFQDGEVH